MKLIDDGVIKYDRSNFSYLAELPENEYRELEIWRKKLFELNLIGEYLTEKISYGNVSTRHSLNSISNQPQFVITGTQTGKHSKLTGKQYSRVIDFDIYQLSIHTEGPLEASSEALTHAAIYSCNHKINAVFHIHSHEIWNEILKIKNNSTHNDIPYGTKEMALATIDIVGDNTSGYFAMGGHTDGVVAFGISLEETGNIILNLYQQYSISRK
jgi:ribulose-5-phosphate 4-epimerase/fuculose-1-phosphate aldolase